MFTLRQATSQVRRARFSGLPFRLRKTEATMATLSSVSDLNRVHQKWIWLLLLGIVFIVLGLICFIFAPAATLAGVMIFGWIAIISGIIDAVQSFYTVTWQGKY